MKDSELTITWNNLDRDDKLEIIEQGIDFANTSEGFLHLRLYRDGSITISVQNKLDNHLSVEAISQTTLFSLFSKDYDLQKEDAEVILNWMEKQI